MKILKSALFLLWMSMFMVESSSATVNITTSRIQYSCSGSTTVFAYPFKVYEDDDLEVISTTAADVEATLILNTDYTVSGAGGDSGGNVTLTLASDCPSGSTLTILRDIDITQDTDYADGQSLTADGLESPPDKSRIIDQQIKESSDRSMKVIKSSTLTDLTVIPAADQAIFFNGAGTGLETRSPGSVTLSIPADESIVASMINTVDIPNILTKLSVYTEAEVDALTVAVAGDTMTGLLTLSGVPTADLHASTKLYVDTSLRVRDVSRNLNILNTAANPTYQMDIAIDEVMMQDTSGNAKIFTSLSGTVDLTASGANGLDTGAEATSTWYHIWAIGQADGTKATLFSLSATAPTMPSGYTYKAYIGANYNDAGDDLWVIWQRDNCVSATNQTALNSGAQSSFTAVSLVIPTTAIKIAGDMLQTLANSDNTGLGEISPVSGGASSTSIYQENAAQTSTGSHTIRTPFTLNLYTAQTMYYKTSAGSLTITLSEWEY